MGGVANKRRIWYADAMDEGRKRVIGWDPVNRSTQIFRPGVPRGSPSLCYKGLAEARMGEVLQPHVGNPAMEEARHESQFCIAANLQQLEVALFVGVPSPLGIQEFTLSCLHLVHQSSMKNSFQFLTQMLRKYQQGTPDSLIEDALAVSRDHYVHRSGGDRFWRSRAISAMDQGQNLARKISARVRVSGWGEHFQAREDSLDTPMRKHGNRIGFLAGTLMSTCLLTVIDGLLGWTHR
jgi:hypothetical protein